MTQAAAVTSPEAGPGDTGPVLPAAMKASYGAFADGGTVISVTAVLPDQGVSRPDAFRRMRASAFETGLWFA